MGRTESIRKSCACGREIKSRNSEMCGECQLKGPARYFMGNAIRLTDGKSEDLAAANVCPKKAAFIDAIIARRKAGAQ